MEKGRPAGTTGPLLSSASDGDDPRGGDRGGGPDGGTGPEGRPGREHRPKRSLGQNFLVDASLRHRIVEEARVGPRETVLEIGPGKGALTEGLLAQVEEQGGHLVLVELDDDLAAELEERFRGHPSVTVLHQSILDVSPAAVTPHPEKLKVVGNIPYNLTSPILFHLLRHPRPGEILLMVQKEVADRILSPEGGKGYGALTVGVRAVAEVELVLRLPPGAFRPRPKVDSAVIRVRPLHPSPLTMPEEEALRALSRSLFQWRRKQLGRILRDHPQVRADPGRVAALLDAARVGTMDRPEQISPEGFRAMARVLVAESPVAEEGARGPGGAGDR